MEGHNTEISRIIQVEWTRDSVVVFVAEVSVYQTASGLLRHTVVLWWSPSC